MHGDRPDPDFLGPLRQHRGISVGVVPAQPHLDRHRPAGRLDRRLHQPAGQVRRPHQGRAAGRARDLLGGAAEIQVDDIGPRGLGHARALGHRRRIAPDQLDHRQRQALAHGRAPHDVRTGAGQLGGGHHLGRDIGRAQPRGEPSERQVGDPGHGRGQHPAGHPYVADLEAALHGRADRGFAPPGPIPTQAWKTTIAARRARTTRTALAIMNTEKRTMITLTSAWIRLCATLSPT